MWCRPSSPDFAGGMGTGQPIFVSAKVGTVCHRIYYDGIARFQIQIFQDFRNFLYSWQHVAHIDFKPLFLISDRLGDGF
jgi:hypothetical protein